jgi:hypothetical protein
MGRRIDDLADELGVPLVRVNGYDDCVIGVCSRGDRLVYDASKVVAKLVEGGASEEEAAEYFEFNIECAYVGPNTPLFVYPLRGEP